MQLFGNSERLILIEETVIIWGCGDKQMDYVMLKDVCAINMGQSPDSNSYNDEGQGVPFFQGNADFGERYPVTRKWCSAPTKMAMPDDILISVRAPIGAMNYAKEECCIGRGLAALTPDKSKVSPQFIFWLLKGKNEELNSKGTGSTFKAIGRKVLEETKVPNIPLEKQMEYSAILEKVFAIIQSRNVQLQKLDELVKARFVEMFGDMVHNPNGWKKVNLGSVCDVRDGTHDSPKYFPEGYPLVTSKNVTSGKIDFTDCSLICKEDYNKINERSKVDFGDILMPMIGTVGKPVIVDVDADFAIKNVALIKFYEDSKVINIFVRALLQSDYFDRVVISKIRGGTQKFIALSDIRKLEICLPPMDTQNEFAAFVEQTDKSKVAIQKALGETHLLFDSLMQKYYS